MCAAECAGLLRLPRQAEMNVEPTRAVCLAGLHSDALTQTSSVI